MDKALTTKDILYLNSIGAEIQRDKNGKYYVKIPHSVLEYYHSLAINCNNNSNQPNNSQCAIIDKSIWLK